MSINFNDIAIESSIGIVIGINQTIIGYPLDTLKIQKQRGLKLNYKNLYSGVKYQLAISSINSSVCFLTFDTVYNHTGNPIVSGMCAGLSSGIIINPLEIYKIRHQTALFHNNTKVFHEGIKFTVGREMIAFTTYFTTYMKLKERYPDQVMINGGLAGCMSWCLSYPMDTLKTHHQTNNNITLGELWRQGNLFKGFGFCMTRAFIVNAINFYIYETLHAISIY
jgi:hypothetical protein